ncbi:MAG: lipoprotein-releasing ABC transporter permease subunit [Alphaproteobacteria bacterium]|nr:lipoprotein-releasing ABC transporter permease subunit [Alphaproteobacteria bacterium]
MFSSVERLIAFRYLRARRKEGFISVIAGFSLVGIALGVATLIVVMSVMNGFRTELLGRILGMNGHVTVYAYEPMLHDYDAVITKAKEIEGVTAAIPIVDGQVMATSDYASSGALVRGIRPEDVATKPMLKQGLIEGSWDEFTGRESAVIGEKLAFKLGLKLGDNITIISPQGRATVMGMVPRVKAYKIAGLFKVGMFEYDSSLILLPMEAAQVYFMLGNAVSAVEVSLENIDDAYDVAGVLGKQLEAGHRVFDWQRSNGQLFGALQVERNVMFLILTMIILVAAFNIISSLIMLVNDKHRDIAILRTMGLSKGSVMRVFLLAGSTIGVLGTLAGGLLGLAFALNIESIRQFLQKLTGAKLFPDEIYFLATMPVEIRNGEVAAVIVMALVLSLLATLYPSWKAARVEPAEALRYE